MDLGYWLPLFFAGAMGLALLIYVVLDGYDLGIGLLLPFADEDEKDVMVAAIGPFWDANETWIVLGVGILLIAFPQAHGLVLTSLYLPVTLMLMGLILRGVSFDFRVKAGDKHKAKWNMLFAVGSLIASVSQGWMLGAFVTGLTGDATNTLFAFLIALALPALYIMLGAASGVTNGGIFIADLHCHAAGQCHDCREMVHPAQRHWSDAHSDCHRAGVCRIDLGV